MMFFIVYLIGNFLWQKRTKVFSILFQSTKTGSRSFEIGERMILSIIPLTIWNQE
jgi:hypothetical protein